MKSHFLRLCAVCCHLAIGDIAIASSPQPSLIVDGSHHQKPGAIHDEQGEHNHGKLQILEGQPIPTVDLMVHKDALKGWNLEIQVRNFRFAPNNVNQPDVLGEGHAHLLINGRKITRLYGNWYYLPHLEPGRHKLTVELNSNAHKTLIYKGNAIADSEIIKVP